MAILKGEGGKFYDIDDSLLEGKELPPDKVPGVATSSPPVPQAGETQPSRDDVEGRLWFVWNDYYIWYVWYNL